MPTIRKAAVIEPGIYQPSGGAPQVVTLKRMQGWVDNFKAMKAVKLKPTVPWDHADRNPAKREYWPITEAEAADAKASTNTGFIDDMEIVNGKLDVVIDVKDSEAFRKLKEGAVADLSLCFSPNFRDGSGKQWGDSILHAAPCVFPVNHAQGGMVMMSLSASDRAGGSAGKLFEFAMQMAGEEPGGCDHTTIKALLESALHLLGGDEEEKDPMDPNKQNGNPNAKAKDLQNDSGGAGSAVVMALSARLDGIAAENVALKAAVVGSAKALRREQINDLRASGAMPPVEADRLLKLLDTVEFALGADGNPGNAEIDASIRAYLAVASSYRSAGLPTLMSVALRGAPAGGADGKPSMAPSMSEFLNKAGRRENKKRIAL